MFRFVYKNIDFAHKIDTLTVKDEEFGRHMHDFNEILFFISGDVNYTIESESHQLQPGEIVLISSGKYHFAEINQNVKYERYVLKFPDGILPEYLIKRIAKQFSFLNNTKKFSLFFQNMDNYVAQYKDEDAYTLLTCELIKMLVMLCNETSFSETKQNKVINQIASYIDENIRENLTLDSISSHFNFSKSYISGEFKKYMKTPIMEYVRYKKIFAAHTLVMQGEKKNAVAEEFGYKDYSTFYRQYKKIIGCTPNLTSDNRN